MNFLQPTYSKKLYDDTCSSNTNDGIVFPLDLRDDNDPTEFYLTLKLANFDVIPANFSTGAIDFLETPGFIQNFNVDAATKLIVAPQTLPANSIMDYTIRFRLRNKTVVNVRTGYDIEWYLQVLSKNK